MITGDRIHAYRAAYNCENSSLKSVQQCAWRTMKIPKVLDAINVIRHNALVAVNESLMKTTIDAAWVLHRAALLADFNIRKFIRVDDQGNAVYNFSNATDDDWYCIAEYTVEEIAKGSKEDTYFVDKVKLKTVDKLRALELVGKHVTVQAFREQIDHSSKDGSMTPSTLDVSKLSNSAMAELLAARTKPDETIGET